MKIGVFFVISACLILTLILTVMPTASYAQTSSAAEATLTRARERLYVQTERTIKSALKRFKLRNASLLTSARRHKVAFCTGSILDMNHDGLINIQDRAFTLSLTDACAKLGSFSSSLDCLPLDVDGDGLVTSTDSSLFWEMGDNYERDYCSVPAK